MKTVSIVEARDDLEAMLDRSQQERVVITRRGRPCALVVNAPLSTRTIASATLVQLIFRKSIVVIPLVLLVFLSPLIFIFHPLLSSNS